MTQSKDRFKGPSNLSDYIDWDYLAERARRYNNQPSDDLLYRIGTHSNILTVQDTAVIDGNQNGRLNPEQRFRVLDFLCLCDFEIDGDLALLIFGREQLEQWLQISKQAYPHFDFYLVFEHHPTGGKTGHTGIDFSMHWMPLVGAPQPYPDYDFPWKLYWECGEAFFMNWNHTPTTQFDFNLEVYPNEQSFTDSRWICQEGDRYTTPSDDEVDLMSVEAVLKDPSFNHLPI